MEPFIKSLVGQWSDGILKVAIKKFWVRQKKISDLQGKLSYGTWPRTRVWYFTRPRLVIFDVKEEERRKWWRHNRGKWLIEMNGPIMEEEDRREINHFHYLQEWIIGYWNKPEKIMNILIKNNLFIRDEPFQEIWFGVLALVFCHFEPFQIRSWRLNGKCFSITVLDQSRYASGIHLSCYLHRRRQR